MSNTTASEAAAAAAAAAQLINLHSAAFTANCCTIAAFAWAVYDYYITFDDEVKYVWQKQWTLAKFLFLWTRYYGLALLTVTVVVLFTPNHSVDFCRGWFYTQGTAGSVMLYTVEVTLQFRIYAMYNRNKPLMIFNGIIFILEILAMLIVYNYGITHGLTLATPPGMTGCFGVPTPYLFSIWLPGLGFESFLLFLALWKAYKNSRENVLGKRVNLLSILIRDSVVYFALISAALFTNAMLWFVGPDGLVEAAVTLSHASMFVGGTRLLLNLRHAYYSPALTGQNTTALQSVGTHMAFEMRPVRGRSRKVYDTFGITMDDETGSNTALEFRSDGSRTLKDSISTKVHDDAESLGKIEYSKPEDIESIAASKTHIAL